MKLALSLVCAIVVSLLGEITLAGEAMIPFKAREGLLEYSQEVRSRISVVIDYLRGEIEKTPSNMKARTSLALLLSIDHPDEAREHLQEVLKVNPKSAKLQYVLGSIAFFQNDFVQAETHFSRAIEIDPQFVIGYNALATVQGNSGEINRGIATLQHALKTLGPRESFYYNLGLLNHALKRYSRSIEYIQQAIALNPYDPEYHILLGYMHLMEQDYQTARPILEKALELDPNNALALLVIAFSFKLENNLDKAIALAEQALKLHPQNSKIKEELEWYKQLQQEKLEKSGVTEEKQVPATRMRDQKKPHEKPFFDQNAEKSIYHAIISAKLSKRSWAPDEVFP